MINLNDKTAVVFGGNGILGSNLIEKLLLSNITKIFATYHKEHDRIDNLKNNFSDKLFISQIDIKDDVSNLILFLSSEYSSYIRGEIICVDGGL